MKKLILFSALLIFACSYGQGEQLYADGTATDQDGNSFEWISYGSQDWTVENAEMVTYRDGTPIPQVTDQTEWDNLITGAWCYYDNDPTKPRLYNGFAVLGIHDNDENTPNKEFATEGWHVPSDEEWTILENYLIANGYNYDGSITGDKIAKSVSSTSGWCCSGNSELGDVAYNQEENNSSGFNIHPVGYREVSHPLGDFFNIGAAATVWSSSVVNGNQQKISYAYHSFSVNHTTSINQKYGFSVRLVRDAISLSTTNFSNSTTIYPNPVRNILTIDGVIVKDVVIYSIYGKEVLNISNQNNVDVSSLSKGIYFIKVSDGINSSTKKFIKN